MKKITVQSKKGDIEEIIYNIDDFPYTKYFDTKAIRSHKRSLLNISASFDIETTTIDGERIYDKNGKFRGYKTPPYGFMYIWQFCLKDCVVMGRTWEEFQEFTKRLIEGLSLDKSRNLVVYIHNEGYEFQFMKDFFNIEKIFAKDKRKPLKFNTPGIEWRCSYFLSNMSLIKFCENSELCYHYKLTDSFDYTKIRTPNTPLTDTELSYCYNDVRGLCECIDTLLQEDNITTLPLTNTGFVRRDCRKSMSKNRKNRDAFIKQRLQPHQYQLVKDAFRGGDTHANRKYTGKILNNINSYDIASSYPAVMMMCYFPTGKFTDFTCDSQEKFDHYCNNYCVIFRAQLYNIKCKEGIPFPYIPIDKCTRIQGVVNDNGRILEANFVEIAMTEIDLEIFRREYKYDTIQVSESMYATRGKLPNELRETIMYYFMQKTLLKDVPGKEYEYMKSKNRLNAIFGMCCTDINHSEIIYDCINHLWDEKKPNLAKSLDKYYNSRNSFLTYQNGIYTTAHARRELRYMSNIINEHCVYQDTDANYHLHDHTKDFEKRNAYLIDRAENNDIPSFVIREGKKYYLGIWEKEKPKAKFKTLGAKKYAYVDAKGNLHVTVSGMNKKLAPGVIQHISNFNINTTWNNINHNTTWYNECDPHAITVNGDTFTTASNIGMLETPYKLGVTNEYWELVYENFYDIKPETIPNKEDYNND